VGTALKFEKRAEALGTADSGIGEVVQAFVEDDLEMQKRLL
jgi:hypothetical protein